MLDEAAVQLVELLQVVPKGDAAFCLKVALHPASRWRCIMPPLSWKHACFQNVWTYFPSKSSYNYIYIGLVRICAIVVQCSLLSSYEAVKLFLHRALVVMMVKTTDAT